MMDQFAPQISSPQIVCPKVLVADDDPCVLRAIVARCKRMGFDVETANSGLQALIKASETYPDLILIDDIAKASDVRPAQLGSRLHARRRGHRRDERLRERCVQSRPSSR